MPLLAITVGDKLKIARAAQYPKVTQAQAAQIVGISREAYASYEDGRSEPKEQYVRLWATAWGIPNAWFWDGENSPVPRMTLESTATSPAGPRTALIPFWGVVPAGSWERPTADFEVLEVPANYAGPNKTAFRVAGDSMAPTILKGDIVIAIITPKPPVGSVVIVRSEEQELTIKRYVVRGGQPVLQSDNPAYQPLDPRPCEFIGQVVHLLRETL